MLFAHSALRYLYLLAALACIGYAAYGLVRKRPYDETMRILGVLQMLSLDLASFFGVAVVFSSRVRYAGLGPHVATMLFAVVVLHMVSAVMRRRDPAERTHAPHLVSSLVALALVWVGLAALGRPIIG